MLNISTNVMHIKLVSLISIGFALTVGLCKPAYSVPTTWANVDSSMAQLLNSGWKIVSQAVYRVVVIAPNNNADDTTFTYTLYKDGKYITCLLDDPKPPIANKSGCRRLN
jgi:hypothetical protein